MYVQNVHHRLQRTLLFSGIFPNSWELLVQILHTYYSFQSTLDYKFFTKFPPTVTKLCHIKCDHLACVSVDPVVFRYKYLKTARDK